MEIAIIGLYAVLAGIYVILGIVLKTLLSLNREMGEVKVALVNLNREMGEVKERLGRVEERKK